MDFCERLSISPVPFAKYLSISPFCYNLVLHFLPCADPPARPFPVQNKAGAPSVPACIFQITRETRCMGNYLPGKNGQKIGIRATETMKQTITRPRPAFT